MGQISHLSLFYESRESIAVTDTDPTRQPNTDLRSVPGVAEIDFADGPCQSTDQFDYEVRQFLISRAMLDPDATVIPQ